MIYITNFVLRLKDKILQMQNYRNVGFHGKYIIITSRFGNMVLREELEFGEIKDAVLVYNKIVETMRVRDPEKIVVLFDIDVSSIECKGVKLL